MKNNIQRTSNQYQVNEKKKNSRNEMMNQKQKQCDKLEQLQDQALIQYYIFEDYQNLINLIYSLQTVNDYFKDDPNNEMVILCRNKVISQLNLSNTIHQDIQETYKDSKYQQFITKEKQKVKEMVSHLPPNVQDSIYLEMYKQNSLSEKIISSYQRLEKMDITPNFDNQVVSQIFSSMQLIDQKVNQIQSQNHYTVPSYNDVIEKAKQYQNLTLQKLEVSIPKGQLPQSQKSVQKKELQGVQQIVRSQSCENLSSKFQQQIQTQNQQSKQQSNENHQKEKQINHLKGLVNLGNY
ncbi:unnamed protein product [Paramecium pentaurelia]|uniref:Uncharacterized protein n=1 Tax=Paramecium pentaurelia TaxID=43138 RepID=A0A8S1UEI2_9CILI|nr:unnamed protein product [Paramecium pentaurelia]